MAKTQYSAVSQDPSQPLWHRFFQVGLFAMLKHRNFAERVPQVIVVEDHDMRQIPDRGLEIGKRARVTGD
jgi:hypothetical protein